MCFVCQGYCFVLWVPMGLVVVEGISCWLLLFFVFCCLLFVVWAAGMVNAGVAGMVDAGLSGMVNAAFSCMVNAGFSGMVSAGVAGVVLGLLAWCWGYWHCAGVSGTVGRWCLVALGFPVLLFFLIVFFFFS